MRKHFRTEGNEPGQFEHPFMPFFRRFYTTFVAGIGTEIVRSRYGRDGSG